MIREVHNTALLTTLAGGFAAALVCGYLSHRLRLSPIVGYLFGGFLVGPYSPGFVADAKIAEQCAEIGVILLMFGVGLHFHLDELLAVRRVAVPGALAQSAAATLLGAAAGRMLGWSWESSLIYGFSLAVASTVVLVRILSDNRDLHTPTGHIAVGWLVVEDLLTVVALVLLPSLFAPGATRADWIGALALTGGKILALVVFTFTVGARLLPWLLDRVAESRSRELFTLTVLVLALGIALGSAHFFGVSMALGAFLAGMVVGRSEYSLRAAAEALPMRDAFAVLFFVSVGMLLDVRGLLEEPRLFLATLAIVLVGKPLVAIAVVLLLRYSVRTSLAVGVALAQIGEFSFILAGLGRQLGLLDETAGNTIVGVSIVSIILNPVLYRMLGPAESALATRKNLWRFLNPDTQTGPILDPEPNGIRSVDAPHRAVVVGYGPTGRTLTRLLQENGVEVSVIELNIDTVRRLRAEGLRAVYGDARHRDTLHGVDVATAGTIVLTADTGDTEEVIRIVRELNPRIRILARSAHLRQIESLRRTGADEVFSGEAEVALALTVCVLQRLGATPELIDRERERVRSELLSVGGSERN